MTKDNIAQDGYNLDEIRDLLGAIAPPGKENKTYKSGNHAIAALYKSDKIRATRPWLFRKNSKSAQNAINLLGEKPESGLYSDVLRNAELRSVEFTANTEQMEDTSNTYNDQATNEI